MPSTANTITATTMLRPRRPRSTMSSISLHESCHSNTSSAFTSSTRSWHCPDVVLMDESQSSSYSDSEDEECTISEVKQQQLQHHVIIDFKELQKDKEENIIQPLCRVHQSREKQNAQRALFVRSVMTLITIVAIAMSYISSDASNHKNNSISSSDSNFSVVTNTNISRSSISNRGQIRKRRLVEIPTTQTKHKVATTSINRDSHTSSIRQGTLQKSKITAVTVSIAQKAKMHRDAMKRLTDQYGVGPHLVEFQIRIWPEHDVTQGNDPTIRYFTIEMAPVHMMPLSVHRFLQQVSNKFWDNTSFFMNVPHLFAAHPISADGRISKPRHLFVPPSTEASYYTEYNTAYPHSKYTLGFVGNGPEFYINKVSNPQHTDPCFANVVIGRSIMDELFQMRGHHRTPDRIRPVEIITARIIQRNHLHPIALEEYVRTTLPP